MGTEANIFIIISGPKKKHTTGKLPLKMVNKTRLEPSSIETFSLEAPDVTEIKKIEVWTLLSGLRALKLYRIEQNNVLLSLVKNKYLYSEMHFDFACLKICNIKITLNNLPVIQKYIEA